MDESRLVPQRVDPLPVTLDGLHLQAHLLPQFSADESSHAMSLPPGRSHDRLQAGARRFIDPKVKCYLPGVPRATYMPYPFHIVQSQNDVLIAYTYDSATLVVLTA